MYTIYIYIQFIYIQFKYKMNFIVDPTNLNKIPLSSYEGKLLLKKYIVYYQSGGVRNSSPPPLEQINNIEKVLKDYELNKVLKDKIYKTLYDVPILPSPEIEIDNDEISLKIENITGSILFNESFNKKDIVGFMKYRIRMQLPELLKKKLSKSYVVITDLKFYKENNEGATLLSMENDLETIGKTFTVNDIIRIDFKSYGYTDEEINAFIEYLDKPFQEDAEFQAEAEGMLIPEEVPFGKEEYDYVKEKIQEKRIDKYITMNTNMNTNMYKNVARIIAGDKVNYFSIYSEVDETDRDFLFVMLKKNVFISYGSYISSITQLKNDVEFAFIGLHYDIFAFNSMLDKFKNNVNFIFSALKIKPLLISKNMLSSEMKEKVYKLLSDEMKDIIFNKTITHQNIVRNMKKLDPLTENEITQARRSFDRGELEVFINKIKMENDK